MSAKPASAIRAARTAKAEERKAEAERKRQEREQRKADKEAEKQRVRDARTAEREAKKKADEAAYGEGCRVAWAKKEADKKNALEKFHKELLGDVKAETNGLTHLQLTNSAKEIAAHREEARKLSEPALKAAGEKLLAIQAALKAQGGSFDFFLRVYKKQVGNRTDCYRCMAVAGGKVTVDELRAKDRELAQRKRDATKAKLAEAAKLKQTPLTLLGDGKVVTGSAEVDPEERKLFWKPSPKLSAEENSGDALSAVKHYWAKITGPYMLEKDVAAFRVWVSDEKKWKPR